MTRLAYLLAVTGAASAQLTLTGVRCGQLTCQFNEFCSPETNRCSPCSVVCNQTDYNYDSGLCVKECQGYLLDLRYMRRSSATPAPPQDLSSIQREALAALIVSGVALAVLVLLLVIVCRGRVSWLYLKQKFQPAKNRVKQYPTDLTHRNPHASEMALPKHELRLETRNPDGPKRPQPLNVLNLDPRTHTEKSHGSAPKTISTVLSNRHPAEDTTLDYSYDNAGMNVTPPEQTTASLRF